MRRQGVRCCVTTNTILRTENKTVYTFLWCYLFNYTTTERLHSLAANSTWFKSVKWWSVFRTPARVIKALTIKGFGKHQNHTPYQYTRTLSRFKLWTTWINDLGSVFCFEWRITIKNHVISYVYFGEGWLWILLGYYLVRLRWKGRWGDRRIRRKGYAVTLGQGC